MRSALKFPGSWPTVSGSFTIGGDVNLARDAANSLALRNGTNPQTFSLNGTYTDGSNYRRVRLTMDAAGAAQLLAEGLGTGLTGNTFDLVVNGTTVFSFGSAGVFASGLSIRCGTTASLQFGSGRSRINSPADGTLNFINAAGSGFTALQFNGTQVLGTRRTGWTPQTATAVRGDLGASPTVGELASAFRALYDDLAAHGLIGA